MNAPVAHQRKLREMYAGAPYRRLHPPIDTLVGCSVETISRRDASTVILAYEWLGDMGRATIFVGLLAPNREILGAACFGYGPAGRIREKIGEPALCLERGACVWYAPPNAASFLIARACKLVHRLTGVERFFAYCDPMAGEYGGVYQAANWTYLGQGLDGRGGRDRRYFVLPPGLDADNPANWKTSRALRRGVHMTFGMARKLGWRIASREAKHVYAVHVGKGSKAWRAKLGERPYPKPRPELTGTGLGLSFRG